MVDQVPRRAGSPSAARAGGGAGRVRFAGFLHGAVVGLAGLGLVCARGRMRRGGEHGGGAGPGSDGPTPGTFVSSVTSGRSSAAAAMVWRTRASSSALSWRSWRSAAWVRSIRVGVRRWPSCWVRAVISASSWPRQARISPSVSRGPDRTGVGAGRAHYRAVAGDHGGIQPVGLGREPAGFGNLAHPFRVDDRSQHALRQESPGAQSARRRRTLPSPPGRRCCARLRRSAAESRPHRCPPPAAARWPDRARPAAPG